MGALAQGVGTSSDSVGHQHIKTGVGSSSLAWNAKHVSWILHIMDSEVHCCIFLMSNPRMSFSSFWGQEEDVLGRNEPSWTEFSWSIMSSPNSPKMCPSAPCPHRWFLLDVSSFHARNLLSPSPINLISSPLNIHVAHPSSLSPLRIAGLLNHLLSRWTCSSYELHDAAA